AAAKEAAGHDRLGAEPDQEVQEQGQLRDRLRAARDPEHVLDRHADPVSSPSMALAEALVDLQILTRRLRRECPWDREQTALTIVPHTVEEAYEVADAASYGDDEELRDELGDVRVQVSFLALLMEERGSRDIDEGGRRVHEKLVRRH